MRIVYKIILIYFLYKLYKYLFENKTNEYFSKKNNVHFMNILDDSDDYVKNLSSSDLRARHVSSHQEYQDVVKNSIMKFTKEEKQRLVRLANEIDSTLGDLSDDSSFDYIKASKIHWYFVKVNTTYENGYPHTRLSKNKVVIVLSTNNMNSSDYTLRKTMLHEKVHVYQKLYPDDTYQYIRRLGFKRSNYLRKCTKKVYIRSNPDLDNYIYVKKNKKYFTIYKTKIPKNINDIKTIPINNVQFEHPFELMAYSIENKI